MSVYPPFELKYHKKQIFISGFQSSTEQTDVRDDLCAIITPHAGLSYCGDLLDFAYSKVSWNKYNKIILISTHHNSNNSIPESKTFDLSSSGKIFEIEDFINFGDLVTKSNDDLLKEHSWLVQMPFLNYQNVKLCILLNGTYNEKIVEKICENIDDQTLLLANTDLLHCGPNYSIDCPPDIDKYNNDTITKIKSMNTNNQDYEQKSMCGFPAIKTFLEVVKKKLNISFIDHQYFTSQKIDTTSDNSVGYATILFYKSFVKEELSLLQLPRKVVEFMFKINSNGILRDEYESKAQECIVEFNKKYTWRKLKENYGIFVTINDANDNLRGCIGNFSLEEAGESIIIQTLKSAILDTRFDPITNSEHLNLKYKINFLKEPFVVYTSKDDKNPLNSLYEIMEFGINEGHGITIYFDDNRVATYLSSVLPKFNITSYEELQENWEKLVISMYTKSGGNFTTSHLDKNPDDSNSHITDKITKISLYYCKEFDEYDDLTLQKAGYRFMINY